MATKVENYVAALGQLGWDVQSWKDSLPDTYACADSVAALTDPIQRMIQYNKCRKGKKLRKVRF